MSPLESYPVQVIVFTPLIGPDTKSVEFEGYVQANDTFRCTNFACSTRDCVVGREEDRQYNTTN